MLKSYFFILQYKGKSSSRMLFALVSSLALPQARPQALQPSGPVTTCDDALDTNRRGKALGSGTGSGWLRTRERSKK